MAEYTPSLYSLRSTYNTRENRPYISRMAMRSMYEDARDSNIQVYYNPNWDDIAGHMGGDGGTTASFNFLKGPYRTDWMDHGWYTQSHANIREEMNYGFLGANPDSVRMDEDLMGLKKADGEWAFAGGGWNPANWVASAFSNLYAGESGEYVTRNYDRIDEILEAVDPDFKFQSDGWEKGIDEEFGPNAPMVRAALEQNGFEGSSSGQGAKNPDAYIYMIKKELRRIAGEQYAKSRLQTMDFIWEGREQSDTARDTLMSIGSDWETVAAIPVTMGVGAVGRGIQVGSKILKGSSQLKILQANLKAGNIIKAETFATKAGQAVNLTDKAGKVVTVLPNALDKLKAAGYLRGSIALPQLGKGSASVAWRPILPSASNLARVGQPGFWSKESVLRSMGFAGNALGTAGRGLGTTLDWLSFIKTNRTLGGLLYQGAGGAFWGGGYGLQHSWHKQSEAIARADFLYGEENHDISYNGGEIALNTLWMGGMGFGLGAAMSMAFGGVGKHFLREGRKIRHLPKDERGFRTWWRAFNGLDASDLVPLTQGDLVAQIGLDKSKVVLGHMIDQITGRTGRKGRPTSFGASLLDKYLLESHHRTYTDLADFLSHVYKEIGNVWLPEQVVDDLVKDFLRKGLKENGGRYATTAERLARNKASAKNVRQAGPTRKPTDALDDPVPVRDYAAGNATELQYDELNKLISNVNSAKRKAKKQLNEEGSVSKELMAEYNNARRALDDFNEKFPLTPDEMAPDIRYRNYNYSNTKAGRAVAKVIEARKNLTQRKLQGADDAEVKRLTESVTKAMDELDAAYPRADQKSRADIKKAEEDAEFGRLAKGPESEATRTKFKELLLERLGDIGEGNKAAASKDVDEAFKANGFGAFAQRIAELGMGNANVVYSTMAELRQLAQMLDNTHVFMSDDLTNWGQNRSVWHAQRHALRDAGHVISVVQSVERQIGSKANQELMQAILASIIKNVKDEDFGEFIVTSMKEFSGETDSAVGAPVKEITSKESRLTEVMIEGARNIREQYKWFFDKYLQKGQEVNIFRKVADADRYVPLQMKDFIGEEAILNIASKAFEVKVASYNKSGYVPVVELEAQGHLVLRKENGNIVGISDIPRDSIFWKESLKDNIPAMADEVWKKLEKLTVDHLDEIQAMADKIAKERGFPPAADRANTGENRLVYRPEETPPEIIKNRLERTQSRLQQKELELAEATPETKQESLQAVANETYILLRQASEGMLAEGEGRAIAGQAIKDAYAKLAELKSQGVEITHYLGLTWSKELSDSVPFERIVKVPHGKTVTPGKVVGTMQPEIKIDGVVTQRAAIVLDFNPQPRKIQTIKSPKDLELKPQEGDLVSHTVESPMWTEPRVVLRQEGDTLIIDGGYQVKVEDVTVDLSLDQMNLGDMHSMGTNAAKASLNPNPINTAADFFVQGEQQIMQVLDEIIHTPLTRRELGISESDLANSGMTIVDVIDFVNSSAFIKNTVYTAWQHQLDIRNILPILIRRQINDAKKVNRARVQAYVDSLVPEKPLAHTKEARARAEATRREMLESIRAERENEFLSIEEMPENLQIARGHMQEIIDELETPNLSDARKAELQKEWYDAVQREAVEREKWIGEGVKLPKELMPDANDVVPIPEKMPAYLQQLKELGIDNDLVHLERWKSQRVEEILSRVSTLKQSLEMANIQAIRDGSDPIYTRDGIYKAVNEEYDGLNLWSAREGAINAADEGRWGSRLREEVDRINNLNDQPTPVNKPEIEEAPTITDKDMEDLSQPSEAANGEIITPETAQAVVNKAKNTSSKSKINDARLQDMADTLGITLTEFKKNKKQNTQRYEEAKRNEEFPQKLKARRDMLEAELESMQASVYDKDGNLIIPSELKEQWNSLMEEEMFLVDALESLYENLYIPRSKKKYVAASEAVQEIIDELDGLGIAEIREFYVDSLARINRKYATMTPEQFKEEFAVVSKQREELEATIAGFEKELNEKVLALGAMKKKDGPRGQALANDIKSLEGRKKSAANRLGHNTRRIKFLDSLVKSLDEPKAVLDVVQASKREELVAAIEAFATIRNDVKPDPAVAQKMNAIQNEIGKVRNNMEKIVGEEALKNKTNAYVMELNRLNNLENRFYNTEVITPEYASDSLGIFHITHSIDLNLGDAQRGFMRSEAAEVARKEAQVAMKARVDELTALFRGRVTKGSFLRGKTRGTKEYNDALKEYEAYKENTMTVGEFMELLSYGSLAGDAAFDRTGTTGAMGVMEDLYTTVLSYAEKQNMAVGKPIRIDVVEDVVADLLYLATTPDRRVVVSQLFDLSRAKDSRGNWYFLGDKRFEKGRYKAKEEKLLAGISPDEPLVPGDLRPEHARKVIKNLFANKRVKQDGKWVWVKRQAKEGLPKEGLESEVPLDVFMNVAAKETLRRFRRRQYDSDLVLHDDKFDDVNRAYNAADSVMEEGLDAFGRQAGKGRILRPLETLLKREENQWLAKYLAKELAIDEGMDLAEKATRRRRALILRTLTDHEGYQPHVMREFSNREDALFGKNDVKRNAVTGRYSEPVAEVKADGKLKKKTNPNNYFVNPDGVTEGRSLINKAALKRFLDKRLNTKISKQDLDDDLAFLEETLTLIRNEMDWNSVTNERNVVINGMGPKGRRQGFFHHLAEYGNANWDIVSKEMPLIGATGLRKESVFNKPVIANMRNRMIARSDNKVGSELANSRTFYGYSTQIRKELKKRLEALDKINRKELKDGEPLTSNPDAERIVKLKQEIRDLQEFYAEVYIQFLDNLTEMGAKPKFEIDSRLATVNRLMVTEGEAIADIPKALNRKRSGFAISNRATDKISGERGVSQLITGTYEDILLLPIEQKILRGYSDSIPEAIPNNLFAKNLMPFETAPKTGVERDIITFMSALSDGGTLSRKELVQEVFGLDSNNKPNSSSLGERLVAEAAETNKTRLARMKEFEKFGVHQNESLILRAGGPSKVVPEDANKLMTILLQEWKKSGVVVYDKSKKGWRLTKEGRRVAEASKPTVIEKAKPSRRHDILNVTYGAPDAEGFTPRMRYDISVQKKMQRAARDKEDWVTWAYHDSQIRRIEAQAVTPEELRAAGLMEELLAIDAELANLRNFRDDTPRLDTVSEERTTRLRKLQKEGASRHSVLIERKEKIIRELKETLGSFANEKPATHTSRNPDIWLGQYKADMAPTIGKPAAPETLPPIFSKFNPETDINWNYRGRTSENSIASNVQAAFGKNRRGYTEDALQTLGTRTALEEAMLGWARRMSGQRAGTNLGDEVKDAGKYRSGGEDHLGDRARVFSADELAEFPEFVNMFETDIRKLVVEYAMSKGVEIRAQEVLNKALENMGIELKGATMTNFRWQDMFELIRGRINNLESIKTKRGDSFLTLEQRRGLQQALRQAEDVYYEMIGKPRYDLTAGADKAVKIASNLTQAIFGPGISQAVATVEIPMSILGRSGNLGDIGHGFKTLLKNIGKLNMLNDTSLEGTAFIAENYERGALARYVNTDEAVYASKWTDRIKIIWKRMWAGPTESSAQSVAMKALDKFKSVEGWDNLITGAKNLGGEFTGLRQVIYAVKDIAVAKAEYAVIQRIDNLYAFAEALDTNVLRNLPTPRDRSKYVKDIARKEGVPADMALRWLRSGLVADKNGNHVNAIIRQLLEWGNANTTTNRLDKRRMHNAHIRHDYSGPMGAVERELVEDTMDRLVNFLEMQAHDFSPEPRGMAGYTKANKNVWGRLFAFYATYPLAFYMTYMKKNPSEAGTIKSLTLLLMVSGFEMFHRQMKAIQNGENIEDLANKWAENPWAMLMREGSSAPWLGFGHNILRDALIMPTTAKFTGDKVYKPTPGLPAPVSVGFGMVEGVQDIFTKGPFTRGKRSDKAPNFMDFLMTGGDYKDADGKRAQASKAAQTLYDVFLTTKFLPFQMLERGFLEYVSPQPEEQGAILAGAISPILGEMIANGEWEAARDMWRTIGKMHADRVNATKITVPNLKVPSEYRIPLLKESKERYKGPRRFSDEKMQNPSLGVTEDLLSTPQYLEVPLDLFN